MSDTPFNIKNAVVLITGGTGFLGGRLAEELMDKDFVNTLVLGGRRIKDENRINHPKIRYELGDLKDEEYLDRLFEEYNFDFVVNCVSKTAIWGPYSSFFEENVKTQRLLLEKSSAGGVKRFIYISSPAVYFNFKNQLGITEGSPLPRQFANNYALTKYESEQLLKDYDVPYIIIRPRAYTGRGDTVMMPKVIEAARNNKLKIIGDGKNVVDICPVANIVDSIVLSMLAPEKSCNQAYNIGYGRPIEIWPVISNILHKLGYPVPTKKIPLWLVYPLVTFIEWVYSTLKLKGEPRFTRYSIASLAGSVTFDISLARKNLGFVPRMTIEEATDEFVAWHLNLTREDILEQNEKEQKIAGNGQSMETGDMHA